MCRGGLGVGLQGSRGFLNLTVGVQGEKLFQGASALGLGLGLGLTVPGFSLSSEV